MTRTAPPAVPEALHAKNLQFSIAMCGDVLYKAAFWFPLISTVVRLVNVQFETKAELPLGANKFTADTLPWSLENVELLS